MYNRIAAYIDCNVSVIADNIARLHLGGANLIANTSHSTGGMGQANTECRIYRHNKAGTVRAVGQAGAAVYVRIAHELRRIIYDCLSAST